MKCWQWGDCGSLCEKRLGLPCAGDSRFLMAPMDPLLGTAVPLSQVGGPLGKHVLERAKPTTQAERKGVRGKESEKQSGNTKGTPEKEKGEEVLQVPKKISAAAPGQPMLEKISAAVL